MEPKTANELASERTDLALARTLMAADRTLMAWVRTGLSMLTFGFTLYKFLMYLRQAAAESVIQAHGPRRLGLVLIGLGTTSMVFGLIEYYGVFKRFVKESQYSLWSFAFIVAVLSTLLGLFLLISILIHREVI